ncbi:unnamed protein product [Symbiodinium sp. CCMP2592]|nr:unnamed protein product [Symbiodinium sp. CCMP2592]
MTYVDISQNVNRMASSIAESHVVPTILPGSKIWSTEKRRLLIGDEMMMLQGFPIHDLPFVIDLTQHQLSDLAGNRSSMGDYEDVRGASHSLSDLFSYASIVIRLGVMSFDVAYISMCDAYDSNMMASVLSQFLPPSPLRVGVQEELLKLEVFPLQAVEDATNGFHIVTWYLGMAGALSLFFIYVLSEAMALSGLMQYGLLGLGVHFGLDQWDEALNHTAIRRKAQNEIRSKFIDDAEVPFAQGPNPSYQGHQGYGTSSPRYATYEKGFSMGSASDFNSTRLESYPRYVEVADTENFEEEEAEAVRALAEKLANEESPGALLDRAIFE